MPEDPFDLQRFVGAQVGAYDRAVAELQAGRKQTHWMWFIFPQLRGLGSSSLAQYYGIASLDEARAYLAHDLLGPRLAQCTSAVLGLQGRSLNEIFGTPDDLKFRSSMTLFGRAADNPDNVFHEALARYCEGRADERTLALLRGSL